jgi:hypothetical protein
MCSDKDTTLLKVVGSPIRTPADRRLLAAPRGISVLAPSFFGSWRQGIRRALFLT